MSIQEKTMEQYTNLVPMKANRGQLWRGIKIKILKENLK
jgi:hypothetical protein